MKTFLASEIFMHTLYKDGEDNECHIGMGNTEGKTYTHSLRQRKVR